MHLARGDNRKTWKSQQAQSAQFIFSRILGWVSKCRGIPVRYDKTPYNYLTLVITRMPYGVVIDKRKLAVDDVQWDFVLAGSNAALVCKKRITSHTGKLLDGTAEVEVIALRLGKPPVGYGHLTLRLLTDRLVELETVESISSETVWQIHKKIMIKRKIEY
jgi:hypothetical protein